jgi:hypothetical protein
MTLEMTKGEVPAEVHELAMRISDALEGVDGLTAVNAILHFLAVQIHGNFEDFESANAILEQFIFVIQASLRLWYKVEN